MLASILSARKSHARSPPYIWLWWNKKNQPQQPLWYQHTCCSCCLFSFLAGKQHYIIVMDIHSTFRLVKNSRACQPLSAYRLDNLLLAYIVAFFYLRNKIMQLSLLWHWRSDNSVRAMKLIYWRNFNHIYVVFFVYCWWFSSSGIWRGFTHMYTTEFKNFVSHGSGVKLLFINLLLPAWLSSSYLTITIDCITWWSLHDDSMYYTQICFASWDQHRLANLTSVL